MNLESFDAGIQHVEIMLDVKCKPERREEYLKHLKVIPNDMWESGMTRLAVTLKKPYYAYFPTIAEIGEACVPGEAEIRERDRWTGEWKVTKTPWTERLADMQMPKATTERASEDSTLPPRAPLTASERQVMAGFQKLKEELAEKIAAGKKNPRPLVPTDGRSPYAQVEHARELLYHSSDAARRVREYWTPERLEQRKGFLSKQLAWMGRRDAAERSGKEFTEPRPQEHSSPERQKAA